MFSLQSKILKFLSNNFVFITIISLISIFLFLFLTLKFEPNFFPKVETTKNDDLNKILILYDIDKNNISKENLETIYQKDTQIKKLQEEIIDIKMSKQSKTKLIK